MKMNPSTILMTVALSLPLAGCKDHTATAAGHEAMHAQLAHDNATAGATAAATANGVGDDATVPRLPIGTKTKCAVSGEDFTVKPDTVQVTYAGQRYAFCCPDCQPTFAKNPAKYAKR